MVGTLPDSDGDEMDLEILRDNRTTNVTIILQERPNWKKIDTSINTSTKKFFWWQIWY